MNGPFGFTSDEIDDLVAGERMGNYALGEMRADTFIAQYVGRSNADLKRRLILGYPKFKFSYADSAEME